MCFQLKLIRKEVYLSFLLYILLFVSTDILLYNYIALGKEEDDNSNVDDVREKEDDDNRNVDDVREKEEDDNSNVDDVREKEKRNDEDIEDISINELLDNDNNDNNDNDDLFDNDNNNNRDSRYEIIEKEDIEDNVPFILPFNAVPFP
jgi:hypothetical protein